jgi:hypothetical protein
LHFGDLLSWGYPRDSQPLIFYFSCLLPLRLLEISGRFPFVACVIFIVGRFRCLRALLISAGVLNVATFIK